MAACAQRLAGPALACALGLPLAGALSGCTVGPDFHAPAAPAVSRYRVPAQPAHADADGPDDASARPRRLVEGRDIPAEWWTLFHCDALTALMRQALAANPDLQTASAALRAAHEAVLAQQGTGWPMLDAQYSPLRQSVAPPLASPLASPSATSSAYTLHTAQISVGYVPDVFGANRRQVEALQAQAEVQRFALEAARLTLAATLVDTVVQRAATQAQIDATQQAVQLAARQLALLRQARALGQTGAADLAAQQAALAQLQATLPPLHRSLAQQADQLAVLTGTPPGDATLPALALAGLHLPPDLPLSLPSQLVAQRPDIRAAQAQWHAAHAGVGAALADRLPSLNLTGGAGSSALRLSQLFGAGTGFWSLGAGLAQPLFDGGTLMHRQRAAEAADDQAAAMYRSTVLVAFQNVADTLAALDTDGPALATAVAAEQAAARSLAIARRQQAAGATGVLPTLAAEQAWRQASLARIQAQAARLSDTVALFQALGGGWWMRTD
jgi:NodT family efflux transporter outer membrane factor (OMF) lipoprotein